MPPPVSNECHNAGDFRTKFDDALLLCEESIEQSVELSKGKTEKTGTEIIEKHVPLSDTKMTIESLFFEKSIKQNVELSNRKGKETDTEIIENSAVLSDRKMAIERLNSALLQSTDEVYELRKNVYILNEMNSKTSSELNTKFSENDKSVFHLNNSMLDLTTKCASSTASLYNARQEIINLKKELSFLKITTDKASTDADATIHQLTSCIEGLRKALKFRDGESNVNELGDHDPPNFRILDGDLDQQLKLDVNGDQQVKSVPNQEVPTTKNVQQKIHCLQVENDALHHVLNSMRADVVNMVDRTDNIGLDNVTACPHDSYSCCAVCIREV